MMILQKSRNDSISLVKGLKTRKLYNTMPCKMAQLITVKCFNCYRFTVEWPNVRQNTTHSFINSDFKMFQNLQALLMAFTDSSPLPLVSVVIGLEWAILVYTKILCLFL